MNEAEWDKSPDLLILPNICHAGGSRAQNDLSPGMVNIANSFYDEDSMVQATFVSQIAKSTRAELWYSYALACSHLY